jgi:hypothetical protein
MSIGEGIAEIGVTKAWIVTSLHNIAYCFPNAQKGTFLSLGNKTSFSYLFGISEYKSL